MHQLQQFLVDSLSAGLTREAITSCSEWAARYRIMGKPFPGAFSFEHHPWSREVHDCDADLIVTQKAAQMGFTEVALNKAFYAIDMLGESVLYLLPANTPDAKDFSTSRFDPALDLSEHLKNLFSDVRNVGHKRAGSANLFVRGSRSRAQIKSIPVSRIIMDELDEFVEANIPLALERTSGQMEKQTYMLSTPHIEGFGINVYYTKSSQHHFMFRCPFCNRLTELIYPECLKITADSDTDPRIKDSYLVCKECQHKLDHTAKTDWLKDGVWTPSYTNRDDIGYYINQLYSMTVKPYELAKLVLSGDSDPADMQEFYNSKLGLTYSPKGSSLDDSEIMQCIGDHQMKQSESHSTLTTMGVDVGTKFHVEIDTWYVDQTKEGDINKIATPKVILQADFTEIEELYRLMHDFQIKFCVIDANPEKRAALSFAQKFPGYVKLCYYVKGLTNSRQLREHSDEEHSITVDRTAWLDLSFKRFRTKNIILPTDTTKQYVDHLKANKRILVKDSTGNPVAKYIKPEHVADHFAHARNYAEIALSLAVNLGKSRDIGNY